jgi:DNA-binding beta-propeller fold protein YncE
MLETHTYSTSGHPTEALATPDGQYVLVTADVGAGPAQSSGIDIFRNTGKKLERVAFQPLGTQGAQGILLVPHTRILAVGLSNAGVAFLPLDDALRGKAKAEVLPQGERSGSGYLSASPDGQFVFVADEYGDGGNIGIIALRWFCK